MPLLTVREVKKRTEAFFKSKGVPNVRLDTDALIAYVLGVKRLELYLDLNRPLTETQLSALRPLVRRRANREPLQYIIGMVDFFEMQLKVDPRALIPRHETEELIELIVRKLPEPPGRILDLGTGTGARCTKVRPRTGGHRCVPGHCARSCRCPLPATSR